LVRGLETLGQAVVDMRGTDAADPRLVLEIALVRLCRRETGGPLQVLADRVDRLEQRLTGGAGPAPAPAARPAAAEAPAPKAATKKRALGAFKQAPKPAAGAPAPDEDAPSEPPAVEAPDAPAAPATPAASDPGDVVLDLDDVIVAWSAVLDAVPRSLRSAIQEAQPLSVDGNVITFGVSQTQIDNVKPRFQKEAHAIREKFIEQLGSPPKFKFTVHSWTGTNGGRERPPRSGPTLEAGDADPGDPGPAPPEDETVIDLVDLEELVDAPKGAGPAVDSISRLEDAFGATVIEEVPRT
jgi:DNA polymerase-3 subunit gamma/tau